MSLSLLLVDDDRAVLEGLRELLTAAGHTVTATCDPRRALTLADRRFFPVAITDLRMPELDGLELARRLRANSPDTAVIVMTAYGTLENAVAAFRLGVTDYLLKPIIPEDLRAKLAHIEHRRGLEEDNRQLRRSAAGAELVGGSAALARLREQIARVAPTDATVLITGESGTGKELVARALYAASRRAQAPFVGINCGAIPGALLESELFGHVKGAFTGALSHREGLFPRLHEGTLFLDEISAMPTDLQAKLLRVLEQKEVLPLGADQAVPCAARVLAASNTELALLVADGRFREDLFYRLNVVPLSVPPLRERADDIPRLLDHFFTQQAAVLGRPAPALAPDTLDLLIRYPWKGNVRELRNFVERTMILCDAGTLTPADLPGEMLAVSGAEDVPAAGTLREATASFQRDFIARVLAEVDGSRKDAAQRLGISTVTLWRYLQDLGSGGTPGAD